MFGRKKKRKIDEARFIFLLTRKFFDANMKDSGGGNIVFVLGGKEKYFNVTPGRIESIEKALNTNMENAFFILDVMYDVDTLEVIEFTEKFLTSAYKIKAIRPAVESGYKVLKIEYEKLIDGKKVPYIFTIGKLWFINNLFDLALNKPYFMIGTEPLEMFIMEPGKDFNYMDFRANPTTDRQIDTENIEVKNFDNFNF
jgi:hypothetical protein